MNYPRLPLNNMILFIIFEYMKTIIYNINIFIIFMYVYYLFKVQIFTCESLCQNFIKLMFIFKTAFIGKNTTYNL